MAALLGSGRRGDAEAIAAVTMCPLFAMRFPPLGRLPVPTMVGPDMRAAHRQVTHFGKPAYTFYREQSAIAPLLDQRHLDHRLLAHRGGQAEAVNALRLERI